MEEHCKIGIMIYYLTINLLLFLAMGTDKLKAILHKRRIPEATLFSLALLGGAPGGFLGMFLFRHKTRKPKFYVIYSFSLIFHIALILILDAYYKI